MSVPSSDTLKASLRCRTRSPDFLDWDWVFSAEGGRRVAFLLPCPGTLARLVKAAVCIANAKNIRTRTRKHLIAS